MSDKAKLLRQTDKGALVPDNPEESFKDWLGDLLYQETDYGSEKDITDIMKLYNLWEGGGKPYIREHEGRAYFTKGRRSSKADKREWYQFFYPDTYSPFLLPDTLDISFYPTKEELGERSLRELFSPSTSPRKDLLAELAHAYQYSQTGDDYWARDSIRQQNIKERQALGEMTYETEGTGEHTAHSIYEPYLEYVLENLGGIVPQDESIDKLAKDWVKERQKKLYTENSEKGFSKIIEFRDRNTGISYKHPKEGWTSEEAEEVMKKPLSESALEDYIDIQDILKFLHNVDK